jgi:hypothetical protein
MHSKYRGETLHDGVVQEARDASPTDVPGIAYPEAPVNTVGYSAVGRSPLFGSPLHEDHRYDAARAAEYADTVERVRKEVSNVMSYHTWDPDKQQRSDAVNVHLCAAMEAAVLNLPPCHDRDEIVRSLSMVRMLTNRALTLGNAIP